MKIDTFVEGASLAVIGCAGMLDGFSIRVETGISFSVTLGLLMSGIVAMTIGAAMCVAATMP